MNFSTKLTIALYVIAVIALFAVAPFGFPFGGNNWVALIVFSVMAFILAFFLARSKEAIYRGGSK
ncbi:MAG: hypothetical protein BWK73_48375 [Thiothrix lacustris]|uniref:Uncharacterized protein n=1 Tax=Thiothrix lacustris TaxID=525917 RepID=A0A1Y1Q9M4_9GAMM|nr:MAG: hypothetical protein BWK73_48375 [Thiothrix lacustris]